MLESETASEHLVAPSKTESCPFLGSPSDCNRSTSARGRSERIGFDGVRFRGLPFWSPFASVAQPPRHHSSSQTEHDLTRCQGAHLAHHSRNRLKDPPRCKPSTQIPSTSTKQIKANGRPKQGPLAAASLRRAFAPLRPSLRLAHPERSLDLVGPSSISLPIPLFSSLLSSWRPGYNTSSPDDQAVSEEDARLAYSSALRLSSPPGSTDRARLSAPDLDNCCLFPSQIDASSLASIWIGFRCGVVDDKSEVAGCNTHRPRSHPRLNSILLLPPRSAFLECGTENCVQSTLQAGPQAWRDSRKGLAHRATSPSFVIARKHRHSPRQEPEITVVASSTFISFQPAGPLPQLAVFSSCLTVPFLALSLAIYYLRGLQNSACRVLQVIVS